MNVIPLVLLGALAPALAAILLTARGRRGAPGSRRSSPAPSIRDAAFPGGSGPPCCSSSSTPRLGYSLVADDLPSSAQVTSPLSALVFFVLVFFLSGGLDEEIGWRGYALDRLQVQFSALNASLVLAVVWIVWHLPVMAMSRTNQSLVPFWLFALAVFPLSVLLSWVYNTTHSIFAAAIFHTIGNVAREIFVVFLKEDAPALTGMVFQTALYCLAAIAIVWRYGPKHLAPAPRMSGAG